MTGEHPAAVHRRSFALVRHAARGDDQAYVALLAEVDGEDAAALQLRSLVQVCGLLLSEVPAATREQLLDEAVLALALAEDVG